MAQQLNEPFFQRSVMNDLQSDQLEPLSRGLEISVNALPLAFRGAELLESDLIEAVRREETYPGPDGKKVMVHIYAGLGSRDSAAADPTAAGWYIFCNGRQVVASEPHTAETIVGRWVRAPLLKPRRAIAPAGPTIRVRIASPQPPIKSADPLRISCRATSSG